jgi:hypothetical protein
MDIRCGWRGLDKDVVDYSQLFLDTSFTPLFIFNEKVISSLTPKPFEFVKSFSKLKVKFPSSYLSTTFSDLHGTHIKSDWRPFSAFQKIYVKIRKTCWPIGRKGPKFFQKNIVHMNFRFWKFLLISQTSYILTPIKLNFRPLTNWPIHLQDYFTSTDK